MLADGADGLDLGGQGSTDAATVVGWQAEWERLSRHRSGAGGPRRAAERRHLASRGRPPGPRGRRHGAQRRRRHADGRDVGRVAAEFDVPIVRAVPVRTEPTRDGRTCGPTRSTRWSSSSTPASPTPTATACATAASSTPAPASPPATGPVGGALPLPEDRLQQPRRAAPVGLAAVHRAAVEGHAAALGADGDRARASGPSTAAPTTRASSGRSSATSASASQPDSRPPVVPGSLLMSRNG